MKTCTKCRLEKPTADFYSGRSACKVCSLAVQAIYRADMKKRTKVIPATKRCPRCGQTKASEQYHRNASRPDGLLAYCKACWSEMGIERSYGVSKAEFDRLIIGQGGLCAICQNQLPDPCVDHDHATGRVRGLLCHGCNHGLGKFMDDPQRLARAITYLG